MPHDAKLRKALARHAALLKDIVSRFPTGERDAIMVALAAAAVGAAVTNVAAPVRAHRAIGETADAALAIALRATTQGAAG